MEIPEARRIVVLSKGIWIGLKVWILLGGQIIPTSILGESLLCRKAQKKEMKKNTSETINRIIPHCSPLTTLFECIPWKVASRVISRHHWKADSMSITNLT